MKKSLFFLLAILTTILAVDATAQPKFKRNKPVEPDYHIDEVVSPPGLTEQVIHHKGYTVSYNSNLLIPNWVAWELTAEEASAQIASRTDQFLPDPAVKGKQADTRDYSNSGYDRGHMAPAADMKWDAQAMVESFYMTNQCPQSKELNEGLWLELEQKCRWWAKKWGKVWIVCGPIFVRGEAKAIGENEVAVPDAFFKCVAMKVKDKSGERYTCAAFVLPNINCTGDLSGYLFQVASIEAVTKYKIFSNIPIAPDDLWALKIVVTESDWEIPGWKSNNQ